MIPKRLLVLALVTGIGLFIGALVLRSVFWSKGTPNSGQSDSSVPSSTPAPRLQLWDDPAGFTFQYPEGVTINKHDEDKENYAHVEFSHRDHPGTLIVWAKDTTAADITAWVRTEKTLSGASTLDTLLGGETAKKVRLPGPPQKLIIATVFDSLLFSIEVSPSDDAFWSTVAEDVATSFAFKPLEEAAPKAGNAPSAPAGDVTEEEVLE